MLCDEFATIREVSSLSDILAVLLSVRLKKSNKMQQYADIYLLTVPNQSLFGHV